MPVFGDKSAAKLNADPADYEKIHYAFFGSKHPGLVAPNSIDVVLTIRNLHDWVNQPDPDIVLASIHRALKRGGTLDVADLGGIRACRRIRRPHFDIFAKTMQSSLSREHGSSSWASWRSTPTRAIGRDHP
jgi:SAM-dependent methyltransferase